MNWINIREEKPNDSGTFLISVTIPYRGNDDLTFNYISHYDKENDNWHKYDPFTGNVTDIITNQINGWAKGLTSYLG